MAIRGRGSNTHGKGTHRRGKGRKGGQGNAGSNDSRWMSTIKGGKVKAGARPGKHGHLGKYGFTRGSLTKRPETVNLNWVSEHFDNKVDLTEIGVQKLLGTGRLTKPLKIKVEQWSKKAEEKIKAAGGEIAQ
ncbi:MAG: 50S ribosomal protein L15 [Candidatus Altiarchaeota archaeon]|nr:50S ribosomal protein L15 [Candidatus Altiarchaeota archaeon]